MANMVFEMDWEGIGAILKGEEMQKVVGDLADKVVAQAGDGYEKSVRVGTRRCYATIVPNSIEASKRNLKNNTLAKALGAARL